MKYAKADFLEGEEMAYNPNMYMPQYNGYSQQPMSWNYQPTTTQANYMPTYNSPQMQQPYDARIKVKGRNGAEAFWMPPNSHAVLFDEVEDVFYYKSTDAAGYASIMDFDFHPRAKVQQTSAMGADYVTREDFDALVARVDSMTPVKTTRARKVAADGE